ADRAPINDVLQILAARSGLNIVTSPEVQGREISIHLRNTPFEEALNLVVRASGLGYERVGHSILVADLERLAVETGRMTRVFPLQHASAPDVAQMLTVLGPDVAANRDGNRVVMRGTQSVLEEAERIIAELDRKPRQVQLLARLVEVNTTALLELGVNWEKLTRWTTIVTEGPIVSSRADALPTDLGYTLLDETHDFYRQREAFEVALEALVTDGTARILSSTKIVTLDGKPAEIFAGETVPVIITSLQAPGAAGGVLQSIQLEKIDVGVRLDITPRITDDGYITALVRPEVSRIIGFVGPDNDLPQTSTRRAATLVRVRDGQKIYLGGLQTEQQRRTVKKVPLLGHIPLLGYLFSHTRNETLRLDLLIEITPLIVTDEGAPPDAGE
ncbi:MAG: secretin and TonB N-terminal domain-containing protein, partial [Candidatus Eisenbacteria bacterium]|nr:secretin and TonB N-terminal domain-containing protein [Candidatus Eisenbacteria bacterium]